MSSGAADLVAAVAVLAALGALLALETWARVHRRRPPDRVSRRTLERYRDEADQ